MDWGGGGGGAGLLRTRCRCIWGWGQAKSDKIGYCNHCSDSSSNDSDSNISFHRKHL